MMKNLRIGIAAGLLAVLLTGCDSAAPKPAGEDIAAATAPPEETADAAPLTDVSIPFTRVTGPKEGEAQGLIGKGGTFPTALYKRWFAAYALKTNVQVSYDGVGSNEGIGALSRRQVDFAATDAPMTDAQLAGADGGPILHITTAFGAIAIAYNVPRVVNATGIPDKLRFTPQTLAGIYEGSITNWSDPLLVRDNPALADVHYAIIATHRSDGSGTTYGFTDYLSAVSPVWGRQAGKGTSVYWPVGIGAGGSKGVAQMLKSNPYSIGYVEAGYAQRSKLEYGLVRNRAGQFVGPSVEGAAAAASEIARFAPADLRFSIVNAPGLRSYPLCTGTWLLAYRRSPDNARALALTRLLDWAVTDGQAINAALGYAPIGPDLSARSEALIRQITASGQTAH